MLPLPGVCSHYEPSKYEAEPTSRAFLMATDVHAPPAFPAPSGPSGEGRSASATAVSGQPLQLSEGASLHRLLLDDSSDPIFALTTEGAYLYINNAFALQLQRRTDELVGKTLWDAFPKEAADQRFRGLRAVIESGQPRVIEVVVEESGRRAYFFTTIKPMRDDGGRTVGVLCISKDITDRKLAEIAVSELNQELEQRVAARTAELIEANRQLRAEMAERQRSEAARREVEAQLQQAQKLESVGQLAGGVAHDFNNMLSVILGNTELGLLALSPEHPVAVNLQEIGAAATHSAELTRQLLAFARKQLVSPQVLDINYTVDSMLKMLRRLIGEDVTLHWRPAAGAWAVRMDPAQVDQIVANLVVNARDAIDGIGNVTIATENQTLDEASCANRPGTIPGQYLVLLVRDDGSGIAPEVLPRIFEPFFTTKELGRGTGLGLATVFGIVRQNDGFILVDTAPGQGSEFRIYLPRHAGTGNKAFASASSMDAPRGSETVLLIEDNPGVLRTTSQLLRHLGYAVLEAQSGQEALALISKHRQAIQLLLSDVVMPDMSGPDLVRRARVLVPGLPALHISGHAHGVVLPGDSSSAHVSVFAKPIALAPFARSLREALARTSPTGG